MQGLAQTTQPVQSEYVGIVKPHRGDYKRMWTSGLYEICDDKLDTLFACCCPCIYAGLLFKKADEPCLSSCCGGLVPLRTKIRTQRGIEVKK
jgi:hypothetical protein